MGLYGFKEQFWLPVLDGSKDHTIRCPRRWPDKMGDTMYLYGKPRRPDMFLLMQATCRSVRPIVLGKSFIEVDGVRLTADERDGLAWRDGFRPPGSTSGRPGAAFALMSGFWRDSMLPLEASLNEWIYGPICFGNYADLSKLPCVLAAGSDLAYSEFRVFLEAHARRIGSSWLGSSGLGPWGI